MSWSPVPLSLSSKNNGSHLKSNELEDISLCSSASKGHQVCAVMAADVKAHSFADRCCEKAKYRVHAARVQWRLWKQDGCNAHLCERNSSLLKRLFSLSGNSPVLIHTRHEATHTPQRNAASRFIWAARAGVVRISQSARLHCCSSPWSSVFACELESALHSTSVVRVVQQGA